MKNVIATLMMGAALCVAAPAFADSADDVKSDMGAINKDKAALGKDNADLANDRAAKAKAKANNDYGSQAGNSVAVGADHVVKGEKQVEKSVDKKILTQHQEQLNKGIDAQTQDNK